MEGSLFLNRFVYHLVGKPEQLTHLTLQLNLHSFFRQHSHSDKKTPLSISCTIRNCSLQILLNYMDYLTKSILLELLNFSTSQNKKLFVVGGAMRDYLSRKSCSDFDLTGKNAAEVGVNFSRALNFTCFPLDKTPGRNTARVILDQNQHLDFTDLQGRNIEEDLSQRDFTINAMSLPLSEFLSGQKGIIDPYKGQEDFSNKKIRVLQGPIFSSDPLRMLRAFRFAATLEFEIDADTLTSISLHKEKLSASAPERIWHELTLFFKVSKTLPLLKSMHDCGLFDCLFPASSIGFGSI